MSRVLERLTDGKWHALDQIERETEMNETQLQRIAEFLKEYSFVEIDTAEKRIRLDRRAQEFLTQEATS